MLSHDLIIEKATRWMPGGWSPADSAIHRDTTDFFKLNYGDILLLHVIPEPQKDYFPNEAERESWLDGYRDRTDSLLNEYRGLLAEAGFSRDAVDFHTPLRYRPSMAECILSEREKRAYDTIVLGRQGLSRKEEFLFGSISNKIVNHAKDCTVWVGA